MVDLVRASGSQVENKGSNLVARSKLKFVATPYKIVASNTAGIRHYLSLLSRYCHSLRLKY